MPEKSAQRPVWDGNPDSLPPQNRPFLYNGGEYYWKLCECECGHPTGFTSDGQENFGMTVRLRGRHQGSHLADVLYAYGWVDDLIGTGGDGVRAAQLVEKMLMEAENVSHGDKEAAFKYLESKGIPGNKLAFALGEVLGYSQTEVAILMLGIG